MFCPKCGAENPDGARFCVKCGNPLSQTTNAGAQPCAADQTAGGPAWGTRSAQSTTGTAPGFAQQGFAQPGSAQPPFAAGAADGATGAANSASKPHHSKKPLVISLIVAAIAAVAIAGFITSGFGLVGSAVKDSVNDYSWSDLQAISNQIASAPSDDEGLKIAEKYHLCSADGKLDGSQKKDVTLTDGTQTSVVISGFRHDDRSDGKGKAGITFIFGDAISNQSMNSRNTDSGGWEQSQMRSWLSSDGMALLPDDLRKDVVAVSKLTNNTGETKSASSVTATDDTLWLYSYNELSGDYSNWESMYSEHVDTFKAEGTTYQLFTDTDNDNSVRVRNYQGQSRLWWERSPNPRGPDCFFGVIPDGDPNYYDGASDTIGVVPGFCI